MGFQRVTRIDAHLKDWDPRVLPVTLRSPPNTRAVNTTGYHWPNDCVVEQAAVPAGQVEAARFDLSQVVEHQEPCLRSRSAVLRYQLPVEL